MRTLWDRLKATADRLRQNRALRIGADPQRLESHGTVTLSFRAVGEFAQCFECGCRWDGMGAVEALRRHQCKVRS